MKKCVNIFRSFLVLVLVCFISFFIIRQSYSKYISTSEIKVFSGVAKPIIFNNWQESKVIDYLNLEKISYNFSVGNFNDELVSEVKFKYNIIFKLTQENAPIKIELFKMQNETEEKIELNNNQTINYEILDLEKESNEYKAEIYYDLSSCEKMINDFGINILVRAVQEEVNNDKEDL